jgi:hypothetical protein
MSDHTPSTEELIAQALVMLAGDDELPEPDPATAPRRAVNGYEQAAAVLGWFDPGTLQPAEPAPEGELRAVAATATPVIDDHGDERWSIGSSRRVEVLADLRRHGNLDRAISANPALDGDLLGRLIRSYATGAGVELDDMPLAELYSVALVCDWLRQAGFTGLPGETQLHDRIDRLELLEPFELLVGTDFVGRKVELSRLRAFLTGRPRGTPQHHAWWSSEDRDDARMLVLYGPAGIGKSTLIAKALLDLARDPPDVRVPFAYLDFDRPAMDAGTDAFPLLSEILRQLAIQIPEAKAACQNIRHAWAGRRLDLPPSEKVEATRGAVDELATLLTSLGVSSRPVVLVLDTFEVVQRRSSVEAASILRLVDLLVENEKLPNLRLIVSGRAGIPRGYAGNLEVAELDPVSAKKLLARLGLTDKKLADRIVRRYGGDPIALKLAAANPGAHRALSNLVSMAVEWFRQLDESVIQRRLYERVLGSIDDPEVRRLAQSGFVLRRLTPGIVLDVLAEPCGLHVTTYDEALRVFEELERETSLVELAEDGALLQRAELRRLMLPLLEADRPELSRTLHRAAIDYYAGRPPEPRERAEEIYHRLKSGEDTQTVAARWLGGVEPFLQTALDELDGPRRAFLASRLGVAVDQRATIEAATDDYERITARKVRAMLDDDRPRDALTALSARRDQSAQSPLVPLKAEAHFALGQVDQALGLLDETAAEALRAEAAEQAYLLSRLQAELVVSAGAWDYAPPAAARLQEVDKLSSRLLVQLGCSTLGAVMTEPTNPAEAERLRLLSQQRFDSLGDEALATDPALVRLVGSLHVGGGSDDDVSRISRAVRLAGLPRQLQGPVRVVAAELASLDVTASAAHGETPGMLSRRYGLRPSPSLTAAWSAFVLGADDSDVRLAVCGVLDLRSADSGSLVTAISRLLGTDPALRRPTGPYSGPAPDVISQVSLSPIDRELLIEALHDIFTPESLRWFLRLRLHQSLDALAPSEAADFSGSVDRLVSALESRGLLLELVARCREVAPGDPSLLRVAAAVGLVTPLSGDLATIESRLRTAGLEPATWQHTLGELEGQVCLVRAGKETWGTGFLVGPDLVLTAASLVGHYPAERLRCQFGAQVSRDGELVTPGTWYEASEAVATGGPSDDVAQWALLRVAGSPGVQPIGGDLVESATGTLRGWVDLSSSDPGQIPDRVLRLGHEEAGTTRLTLGAGLEASADPGRYFHHDLPSSAGTAGAPLCAPDLTPFGLQLGTGVGSLEGGTGVRLAAVLDDLVQVGLDHLVRTTLA